jgi:hypothetical protein
MPIYGRGDEVAKKVRAGHITSSSELRFKASNAAKSADVPELKSKACFDS